MKIYNFRSDLEREAAEDDADLSDGGGGDRHRREKHKSKHRYKVLTKV